MHSLVRLFACLLVLSGVSALRAQGVRWQPLYEPGSGGWITSFSADPRNPQRTLIGGDMLGIGYSDNRGDAWMPAMGLTSYEICDFTWHPTQPGVVWAGSFAGPIKSTDGGKTWVVKRKGFVPVSTGTFSEIIEKVLFDPNNPDRLVAVGGNSRQWNNDGKKAGLGAIYESADGGETWTLLTRLQHGGAPGDTGDNILSAWFAPGSSNVLYANTSVGGVIVSEDSGKTWQPRNEGLPHKNVLRILVHPKQSQTLWASLGSYKEKGADKHKCGGIYKSTDGGKTWNDSSKGLFQHEDKNGNFTAGYKGFAVSPANPDVLATSDTSWNKGGIFLSRDGGATWKLVATKTNVGHESHADGVANVETAYPGGLAMTSMHFDPADENTIYALGGEFALRTTDGGKSWADVTAHRPDPSKPTAWRGNGYSGLCASDFVFHPTDPKRAMVVALDAGKVLETLDGGQSWTRHGTEPWPWGGAQAGTYSGDYGYVTAGQFGEFLGIAATRDGGKTWRTLLGEKHGLPPRGKGEPRGIFADPLDGKRVWASIGNTLYFSSDAGEQWKKLTTPEAAIWITGNPAKPGELFLSGNRGLYVSGADGQTFTSIGGPNPSTLGMISADSLGRLYVCQWRAALGGVWRYDGKGWERLLDDRLAKAVDIDPTDPNRLAMVTNDDPFHDNTSATGVWLSSDAGKTWSQANDGLAMLRGRCIRINPTKPEQLVVGTWGGGYYTAEWPKSYKQAGTRSYVMVETDRKHAARNDAESDVQRVGSVTLRNGSFSSGTDAPEYWTRGWVGRGDIKVARDTDVFKQAPSSLRVDSVGDSLGQVGQQVDCKAGERFTVSGSVKSKGKAKVSVAIQSFDNNWQPIDFQQVGFVMNSTDWTDFKKDVTLPKGTGHAGFVVLIDGEGTAWADELQIAALEPSAGPDKPLATEGASKIPLGKLKNGDMTVDNKHGLPRNWESTWTGKGKLAAAIDREVFKSEPASLRLGTEGDDAAQGQVAQIVGAGAGTKVELSGFVKSAGDVKVSVFVQPMNEKWTPINFTQVAFSANDTDWAAFDKMVELPEGTVRFGVGILVEGKGKAWLDDVKLKLDGEEAAAPADQPDENYQPAKVKSPIVPSAAIFPQHPKAWTNFHNGFKAQAAKAKADLVFFGDSITQSWHKKYWEGEIKKLGKAFNFGIGGDGIQNVLWRIQNGELEGQSPKVVVVAIGVNNFWGKGGSDDEMAQGVGMIVDEIKQRCPTSKILVVGILPTQREKSNSARQRVKNVNALYAKLADDKQVFFTDVGDKLLADDGTLPADVAPDALHLNEKGYGIYAEHLVPVLKQLLGSDAASTPGK